jgi:uncharacterized phosphosugar-binding protein
MSKPASEYLQIVSEKLRSLEGSFGQKPFTTAVNLIFESLKAGGVWNIFGAGHSTMAVQEAFHRAGGLIPINPWLEEYMMPQSGPTRNGGFEKLTGVAEVIFDYYKPNPGEVLTIISNSGINATSIEMAEIAKKRNVKTIGITNLEHSKSTPSRHSSGKKVFDVCDIILDTGGVKGDAAVTIPGVDVCVGPLSTVLNCFIINSLTLAICQKFVENSLKAPVYASANLPGGAERNRDLERKYLGRIPRLR